MKKLKAWKIVLILSIISLSFLFFLIYNGFSGNSASNFLYKENVDGRLIKVSNYIDDYIISKGKLPSEKTIREKFQDASLFKCSVTNEPLMFIPNIENRYSENKNKTILIFNPKSYYAKKQRYASFGDGRKVRNKHSFHIALILVDGKIRWEALSSNEFFDTLLPQLQNDSISSSESIKEIIIPVIEFYLNYSNES